jgi:hypothetical protein
MAIFSSMSGVIAQAAESNCSDKDDEMTPLLFSKLHNKIQFSLVCLCVQFSVDFLSIPLALCLATVANLNPRTNVRTVVLLLHCYC